MFYYLNNETFFSDIKLLMYPKSDKYVLCAHHLLFDYEKKDDGSIHFKQINPVYFLSLLGQEKDFCADNCFNTSNFFKKIVAINDSSLLFTIKNENYFFEVECENLKEGLFGRLSPSGNIRYYSHKYDNKEMALYFREAIDNLFGRFHSSIPQTSVIRIEKINSKEDLELFDFSNKKIKDGLSFHKVYPEWAKNKASIEMLCSFHVFDKIISFEVKYDNFTPHYNSDRDGGWYVYTHTESIVGEIHFQTVYSLQEYLLKLEQKTVRYEYEGNQDVLECRYPLDIKGYIYFSISVNLLFYNLNVKNIQVLCETFKDNVCYVDDNWIYGGSLKGFWQPKIE